MTHKEIIEFTAEHLKYDESQVSNTIWFYLKHLRQEIEKGDISVQGLGSFKRRQHKEPDSTDWTGFGRVAGRILKYIVFSPKK